MLSTALLTYVQAIQIPELTLTCVAPYEPFLVLMYDNTSKWFCL